MSSNINPAAINGAYPIAGQDNDTQGFRDNFTNIRNNLASAKLEIEELQSKAVLKSALVSSGTADNNFGGSILRNAKAVSFTKPAYQIITMNGLVPLTTIIVSYTDGDFQILETTAAVTLEFAPAWPTGTATYASFRVLVNVTDLAHTITLDPIVTVGYTNVPGINPSKVITPPATGHYLFEFSTYDGGQHVIVSTLNWPQALV
jgi:hypothetical protein